MATVFLGKSDALYIDTVKSVVERELATNCNLSGATINVEVGDHTSVDGLDEIVGAVLLATVRHAIDDEV